MSVTGDDGHLGSYPLEDDLALGANAEPASNGPEPRLPSPDVRRRGPAFSPSVPRTRPVARPTTDQPLPKLISTASRPGTATCSPIATAVLAA
jgi:hypothetical protein